MTGKDLQNTPLFWIYVRGKKNKIKDLKGGREIMRILAFRAFFAASAPDRLSKVTNPTGWKTKILRVSSTHFTLKKSSGKRRN